ncbi:MAG: potassium efflux system protein [Gammaproteobacteria bacterium]|jgi:potassium efflux system protein
MMSFWARICGLAFLIFAGSVQAQSLAENGIQQVVQATDIADSGQIAGIELSGWDTLATRAEGIAETGAASQFALGRVRAELVGWRDQFSNALGTNANRLITVRGQIDAFGVAANGVDPVIAARLAELMALQDRLLQPQLLAQEAFARANGLITEIDRQQRALDSQRLATRSASPANPTYWPAAFSNVQTGLSNLGVEFWSISAAHRSTDGLVGRLSLVVVALIGAAIVLTRARAWITLLAAQPLPTSARSASGLRFVISLASVVIPVLGLVLVTLILEMSGLFGPAGERVIAALPFAGGMVFVAKWLSDFYFPISRDDDGILGYPADVRGPARRLTVGLGWVLAVAIAIDALLSTVQAEAVSIDVVNLPLQLIVGALMWRLGQLIVHQAGPNTKAIFNSNRLRVFIGRAACAFAVAGPLASLLGYGAAAAAITVPAVTSLATIAVIVVLQRLSYAVTTREGFSAIEDTSAPDPRGLLPVTINFALSLFAVPVLALIWGVSWAELVEVWTRFLSGFSVGETRISPSNFLMFILIFMVGALLTRFIKTALKTTVMPRTRFDLGGQNAVVAGFGYVGIFLSALVAFGVAGIDLSSLAIVAGALSVGIGFGLQNIVSNFVSGIILLIERPVVEGDMIEVGGQMGYVRDISVRSTRIETFDRTDVIIPNADLISNQVTNWTRGNLVGRAIVPVGVAYGSDTAQVTQILQEIAEAHPLVLLNPPPSVLLTGFGADSIDFEIRAIIRDVNFVLVVKSEMLQSIIARFDAAGIEIPFAQRDLWLRNPEALHPKKES